MTKATPPLVRRMWLEYSRIKRARSLGRKEFSPYISKLVLYEGFLSSDITLGRLLGGIKFTKFHRLPSIGKQSDVLVPRWPT